MLGTPHLATTASPIAPTSVGFMYGLLAAVIIVHHAYVFTFNWVPELRLPLSSMLTVFHIVLAGLMILLRPAPWNVLLLLSVAILVLTLIPTHFMGLGEVSGFDPIQALRKIVLPLMMIWMLASPLAFPKKLACFFAIVGTLFGAFVAFTGPVVYVSGTARLASITGGLDGIHVSAKFIALTLILLDLLRRGDILSRFWSWMLILVCAATLIGYGGRNEMVLVLTYYLMLLYFYLRGVAIVKWSPPLILVLILTIFYLALYLGDDVHRWGSGRIGAWDFRLGILADRDLITKLFGGGIGADTIWVPVWGYHTTGMQAHNDYLHLLMEHGLFGLLFGFVLFVALWMRIFEEGRAVLVGVMANSFLANGFFNSPMMAVTLAIVLSTSMRVSLDRLAAVHRTSYSPEATHGATPEGEGRAPMTSGR
jgi:hypothetical protein